MRSLTVSSLSFAATLLCCTATAGAASFPLTDAEHVPGTPGERIELLDFDGDGLLDIASVHSEAVSEGADVTLVRGLDDGWAAEQRVTVPDVIGPQSDIVAADVTGDGRDDILAAFGGESGQLAVLRGNAEGTLTLPPAGDVHPLGDGSVGGLGDGPASAFRTAVDVGDVDGDSDVDVVAAVAFGSVPFGDPTARITVFVNDGGGGLTPTGQTLTVGEPSDLVLLALGGPDGDADLDLVVAQFDDDTPAIRVFSGAAGASFGAGADLPAGIEAERLDWGDFDGDARNDVAVSHQVARRLPTTILPGTSAAPGLGAPIEVDGAVQGHEVAAGDLDDDGIDDLYVADGSEGLLPGDPPIWLRGLGAFAFERLDAGLGVERKGLSPRVGDVDGDGRPDVVTSGSTRDALDGYFIRYGRRPELVQSPSLRDFGLVALGGRSAAQSVQYTNDGPGTAVDIRSDVGGDVTDFPLESDTCAGATLAVGDSCTLTFAFAPTAAGARDATVEVYVPDADAVHDVTLSGTGVAAATTPPPAIAPPPAALTPAAVVLSLGRPTFTAATRRAFLRRGLRFTQRLPAAGRASWTLEIPASGSRKRVVVGRAARTVRTANSVRMTIRADARGVRQIRRRGVRRLVLRTVYRPTGSTQVLRLTSRVPRLR